MHEREILSVLGHQYQEFLHRLAAQLDERPPYPRRNADLCTKLKEKHGIDRMIHALPRLLESSKSDPRAPLDPSSLVFQHGRHTVGVLGYLRSNEERRAGEAKRIATALADMHGLGQLAALADEAARRTGNSSALESARLRFKDAPLECAYLQLALSASDAELADAIDTALSGTGAKLRVSGVFFLMEQGEEQSLPWIVTRWGILRRRKDFDEGDPVRSLSLLVDRHKGSQIAAMYSASDVEDRIARISELVLANGPVAFLRSWFAPADIWALLADGGLTLPPPPRTSQQELEAVFLTYLGLRATPAARGLYTLFHDLTRRESHRTHASDLDAKATLLADFERGYDTTLLAYLALAARRGDQGEVRRGGKLKDWASAAGLGERSPFHGKEFARLTLGEKADTFKHLVTVVESQPQLRSHFDAVRRPTTRLGGMYGDDVRAVIAARNDLMHGREGVHLPQLIQLVRNALVAMAGGGWDDAYARNLIPISVRIVERHVDEYQFGHNVMEDELGRRFQAHAFGWHRDYGPFSMFCTTSPVAIAPTLIRH